MRCALGLCLRRDAHDLRRVNARLAPAARQVRFDGLQATDGEATAPRNDLPATDLLLPRYLVIANALGRKQHNPRTPDATSIQRLRPHPALQLDALLISQYDRLALIHHSLHRQDANKTKVTRQRYLVQRIREHCTSCHF